MTDPGGSVPDHLGQLVELAVETAEAAGALAASMRRGRLDVDTKSTHTDLVTDADRAAEALIAQRLDRARPHDGLLGEEGGRRDGSTGIVWVVDPIDGTTNYVYDHPGWAVSVAACHGGRPVAAAVCVPSLAVTFRAQRGGGAFAGEDRLTLGSPPPLDRALVATGFGYDAARRARQAEVLGQLLPRVRDVRRMGAASVDLCSVAAGRVDAYFERGLSLWDLAGGWLVAEEAGAVVGDLARGAPSGDMTLAAAPPLFEELRRLLTAAGADRDRCDDPDHRDGR